MEDQKDQKISLAGSPEKMIPKFSNSVNINQLENGDITMVFTFLHSNDESGVTHGTPIESIVVDQNHAKQISDMLLKTIK